MTTTHKFPPQVAELNSKINEMEEESLIDSGRARIAGTRTKMELAWQKERESQKKLINELNTMARDLKSTLLEVEKEKERDRLDSKRKIDAMKRAFEEEQDDTKKQITDLQGWKCISLSHCQELGQLAVLASDWFFTLVQPILSQLAC